MDVVTLSMAKAYTDKKAGYTEMSETVILPEMTITKQMTLFPNEIDLVIGEHYIVKYDGIEYECECFNGWGDTLGSEEVESGKTGEFPFMITEGDVTIIEDGKSHTISIYQRTETVHTIDPKYLPAGIGGGLPVVTINTSADGEYEFAALTEEEAAQMEAVVATGMPIILRMAPQQDITVSLLCYDYCTIKGTDGTIGQYVAKSESDGTGYFVIQKADFTAPWQIAWGADLSQMAM